MHACLLQESFYITDDIDGSATSYTVTYLPLDTLSGRNCYPVQDLIPAPSCLGGVCYSNYSLSSDGNSCSHSSNISVGIHATNILGNGPKSVPVYIEIAGKFLTHCMYS